MHIFCCESDIQKFRNYLIDDGSTDGAGDICDCWAEKDRRILVFHKEETAVRQVQETMVWIKRAIVLFLLLIVMTISKLAHMKKY